MENEEENDKKDKTTDYTKLAKAIGDIRSKGIKISLVDINKSTFSFKPDTENNEILFGLKGVNKVGDAVIEQIIKNRPYSGIVDFMQKCPLNKTVMIALIKAGAFDKTDFHWASKITKEPRQAIMGYYLFKSGSLKKKLTLQNFNGLMQKGLIPSKFALEQKVFSFNKFLKSFCKKKEYYILNEKSCEFYCSVAKEDELENINIFNNGCSAVLQSNWDKIYKRYMDNIRFWLKDNQKEILDKFNFLIFKELWDKYAFGTISAWEMESLCFYYHDHELANVDINKYGISDFNKINSLEVDYYFKRNGKEIPIYKTYKIMGTVLSKNDARSSISLLTPTGVVSVKFTKEYYAMFNRQISQPQADGTKKVIEKGWFTRGTKLLVTGIKRDNIFQAKRYAKTPTHQLYLIENVKEDNSLELRHDRAL